MLDFFFGEVGASAGTDIPMQCWAGWFDDKEDLCPYCVLFAISVNACSGGVLLPVPVVVGVEGHV